MHPSPAPRDALVLTISDRVSRGATTDRSGPALVRRLQELGFAVTLQVVPDERERIERAIREVSAARRLIVTTGGTGLAPRDVTPEALRPLLDYEIPGFGERMRAEGRRSTPFADLSRSLAGVMGRSLVVALPGSPSAALESLEALVPMLDHALDTLVGTAEVHPPDQHPPEPPT